MGFQAKVVRSLFLFRSIIFTVQHAHLRIEWILKQYVANHCWLNLDWFTSEKGTFCLKVRFFFPANSGFDPHLLDNMLDVSEISTNQK